MSGLLEADGATALMPVASIAGIADMWLEADGDGNLMPRLTEADPNFPPVGRVRNGTAYGYLLEYLGTDVLPVVGDVKLGTGYGADGTEFIGTYTGGTVVYPTIPTLLMAPNPDGVTIKATIFGSDAGTLNQVYVLRVGTWSWYLLGSRIGDGDVTVTPGARGEYRSFILSTNATGGRSANAGEDFWMGADTVTRRRIRDDVARAYLRIASRLGKQVIFQNPGEVAVTVWAIISPSSDVTQMRDGVTDVLSITVGIPRQSNFPTAAGVIPGAVLTLNSVKYQVDTVEADNEDLQQASSWTLRCGKYGYTVELDF